MDASAPVPPVEPRPADPVRAARARVRTWVKRGKRAGYGALLVAIVAFAVALATDLPGALVAVVIGALVVSCLTLLPATIFGYAANAADREDAERGVPR